MAEQISRFKPGVNVPAFAKTAVTAGRFVKIVDDKLDDYGDYQVGHCGAGERAFGVAELDSAAATEPTHSVERRINIARRGAIARVTAGGALSAGDLVQSSANGRAVEFDDDGTFATLNTGTVGANNAITWTSRKRGTDGNDLSVTIIDPPGNNASLSVDVDGDDIVVSLATDGASAPTSTAAQVIAAVLEHDTASQLVTAENTGASSGAGVVAAVSETSLAGGVDVGVALGQALNDAAENDVVDVDLF